jgi:predicted dehydrogenase
VARDLKAAGATVPCFLGTQSDTVELAARGLFEDAGIEARGYTSLEEMLRREELDALAILSPAETHESYLSAASEAGLHVLCEKPLIWGGLSLFERATRRVTAFGSRGLLLGENCQWTYALPGFEALHPGALSQPPRTLAMRLSPVASGAQILGDSLPHPLSVLQALLPGPRPSLANVRYEVYSPDLANLGVTFDYRAGDATVQVEVELRQSSQVPRAAGLEIDGRRAERKVSLPDYDLAFSDGRRTVPVSDPLSARIRAFVADLRAVMEGAAPPDPTPILDRMGMIEVLLGVYASEIGGSDP